MTPIYFPECNTKYGPPKGLEESQVMTIPAYVDEVKQGSVDGLSLVVVAWQPTAKERSLILLGCPIYISMVGGLAPHFLCTTFDEAINPA